MLRGLYTATAGMASEMSAIDLLSNNVANTNTEGFKEDFETLLRQAANPLSYGEAGLVRGTGVLSVKTAVDLSQGPLTQSNSPLDLALQGNGFFALQSPGGVAYSRNGRFHLSPTGQLTSEGGNLLLGVNAQPLTLPDPQGQAIIIKQDGTVSVGGTAVGQIGVFDAPSWQKGGNDLYTPGPGATAAPISTTLVRQGMIEGSNIDLVSTMGAIMSTERSYEADSQLQKMEDEMLQQGVSDVGRMP